MKMCESNEYYVPLNDGYNWKGDPNATLSGQPIPQLPPGSPPAQAAPPSGPAPPPVAAAEYDPATGTYVGPDGRVYTQSNPGPQRHSGSDVAVHVATPRRVADHVADAVRSASGRYIPPDAIRLQRAA